MVTDKLLETVTHEWADPNHGRAMAIERAAQLGAILKGFGYRGIHLGGIHKDFAVVAKILDRMEAIENDWETYVANFEFPQSGGFYAFDGASDTIPAHRFGRATPKPSLTDRAHFRLLDASHHLFFNADSSLAPLWRLMSQWVDKFNGSRRVLRWMEDTIKRMLLDCQQCGDCGIQHVAFLCPESECPKHTRNGACGGSARGWCEVYPDRRCVWFRAYRRWAAGNRINEMVDGCIPPRMWELNHTSSWLNFHLKRDHQSASTQIARHCSAHTCRLGHSLSTVEGEPTS